MKSRPFAAHRKSWGPPPFHAHRGTGWYSGAGASGGHGPTRWGGTRPGHRGGRSGAGWAHPSHADTTGPPAVRYCGSDGRYIKRLHAAVTGTADFDVGLVGQVHEAVSRYGSATCGSNVLKPAMESCVRHRQWGWAARLAEAVLAHGGGKFGDHAIHLWIEALNPEDTAEAERALRTLTARPGAAGTVRLNTLLRLRRLCASAAPEGPLADLHRLIADAVATQPEQQVLTDLIAAGTAGEYVPRFAARLTAAPDKAAISQTVWGAVFKLGATATPEPLVEACLAAAAQLHRPLKKATLSLMRSLLPHDRRFAEYCEEDWGALAVAQLKKKAHAISDKLQALAASDAPEDWQRALRRAAVLQGRVAEGFALPVAAVAQLCAAVTAWRDEALAIEAAERWFALADPTGFHSPAAGQYFRQVALGLVVEEVARLKRQVDADDVAAMTALGLLLCDAEFEEDGAPPPGPGDATVPATARVRDDAALTRLRFNQLPGRLRPGEWFLVTAPLDPGCAGRSRVEGWSGKVTGDATATVAVQDAEAFAKWQASPLRGTAPVVAALQSSNDLGVLMKALIDVCVHTNRFPLAQVLLPGARYADVAAAGAIGDPAAVERRVADTRHALNESQRRAVVHAASHGLTLVQGPPGTGKTTVAAELTRLMVRGGKRVLVMAVKNVALDNILLHVLRIGCPPETCMRVGVPQEEGLQRFAVDKSDPQIFAWARQCRVICLTNTGLCGIAKLLRTVKVDMVIMDEVSQCTEALTLPGFLVGSTHIVLVGDQNQLPPAIHSDAARERDLVRSIYQHILDSGCDPVLLDTQYRMHPAIADFPMRQFYEGRIRNGVAATDRPLPPTAFPWPRTDVPVAVVDMEGAGAECRDRTGSYYNVAEVEAVRRAVRLLLRGGGLQQRDIAIISPYQGQSFKLHQRVRDLLPSGVRTVDSFQGRHTKVIIVSMVRSNSDQRTGFVKDWRRLNVMMTRAQYGFIVLADAQTLQGARLLRDYLAWARRHRVVVPHSILGECSNGVRAPPANGRATGEVGELLEALEAKPKKPPPEDGASCANAVPAPADGRPEASAKNKTKKRKRRDLDRSSCSAAPAPGPATPEGGKAPKRKRLTSDRGSSECATNCAPAGPLGPDPSPKTEGAGGRAKTKAKRGQKRVRRPGETDL